MDIELVRKANTILHIIFGSVAMFSGLAAICQKKGLFQHINTGKIYLWAVLAMTLTAMASNIITLNFPTYLIGFMALYLAWFGKVPKKLKLWEYGVIAKGILTSLFFIYIGKEAIITNTIEAYCFSLFGIVFLYFSVTDFWMYVVEANWFKESKPTLKIQRHLNCMIFSYYLVITGFTISQFSWLPGNLHLLVWILPLIMVSPLLIYFNLIFTPPLKSVANLV